MNSYFDSSLLLAILFDEKLFDDAWNIWNSSEARVSSIILKIETNISLQRYYKTNARHFDGIWLNKKEKILNDLLDDIFYKPIEEPFGNSIAKNKINRGTARRWRRWWRLFGSGAYRRRYVWEIGGTAQFL